MMSTDDESGLPTESAARPRGAAWISREELTDLSRIPTVKVVLTVALLWGALFAFLELALRTNSWLVLAMCFLAVGVLINAVGSYWTHEATHYHVARDRTWNDLLGDLFMAGPTGVTVAHYRWQHFRHHAHVNDPEAEIDQSAWICLRGGNLFVQALYHLAGLHAVRTILRYRQSSNDPRKSSMPPRSIASVVSFVVVNGAVFLRCVWADQWYMYFAMWVAPLFTIAVTIANVGTIVEHQPSSDVCDVGLAKLPVVTRVMRAGWIERLVFGHVGFYYHFDHHLYPGVPVHRLPELRALLETRGCFEQPGIQVADGYLRTLYRLSRDRAFGVPVPRKLGFETSPRVEALRLG